MMVDVPLITEMLRRRGYTVTHTAPLSDGAGAYEFEVDGRMLVLQQVNALLETDEVNDENALQLERKEALRSAQVNAPSDVERTS